MRLAPACPWPASLTVRRYASSRDGDYRSFIKERVAPSSGEIVDTEGNVLGWHNGVQDFTVGQRRGLGITAGKPLFVLGIDAQRHRVIVGEAKDLLSNTLRASQVSFTGGAPSGPVKVDAKIRYKASEAPAVLYPRGDSAVISFQTPQRAVTPGQAVAFYRQDELIGGGIIEGPYLDPMPQ